MQGWPPDLNPAAVERGGVFLSVLFCTGMRGRDRGQSEEIEKVRGGRWERKEG